MVLIHHNCAAKLSDSNSRSYICSLVFAASLICGAYFIVSAALAKDFKQGLWRWDATGTMHYSKSSSCKNRCRAPGSEALPEGIIAKTSNFEMRPLWSHDMKKPPKNQSLSLLTMAVGMKQSAIVDKIIQKFPSNDFVIMLFHYDGVVDEWRVFPWHDDVLHVSAVNQTKWWYAKRFLHPDIVAEYEYIFLWDEDLGVQNFNPKRYLSIVKGEGLEISQPALDPTKSDVHHPITARNKNLRVHRRMYKNKGSGRCDEQSTSPPCIGWVELMAPVFSRAAWRCAWYMIQNDLIHAWGLDKQLGYCAQGDRMKKVGVVDAEYIVHLGLPTLGAVKTEESSEPHEVHNRLEVRRQSYVEMKIFKKRWRDAVMEDKCWLDPFQVSNNLSNHRF